MIPQDQDQNKIQSPGNLSTVNVCCASRQAGKAVLKDVMHRLSERQRNLQILIDMLPENPTPEQDQALWALALEMERR